MNLPSSPAYNLGIPWVSKVHAEDGELVADLFTYCNGLQLTSGSSSKCWSAHQQVMGICSYLGIQDAISRWCPPSQTPGIWSGTLSQVMVDGVEVLVVSQDKWDKTKHLIQEIREQLAAGPTLNHKELQCMQGLLIYMLLTYAMIVPYFIGLHHTLDHMPWMLVVVVRMKMTGITQSMSSKPSGMTSLLCKWQSPCD